MAMTEGDKAICRDIAREIIQQVLKEHIASCPHGRVIYASKWLLTGMCAGSGLAGGGLATIVIKLFAGL